MEAQISYQMKKKTQCSIFKIETCVTFQSWIFFSTAIITQKEDGAIYDKTSSSHDVCKVTELLKFLVCLTDVLPQSKGNF